MSPNDPRLCRRLQRDRVARTVHDRNDPLWRLTPPSSTLLKFGHYLTSTRARPVLDAGCGFGRNAVALALRGLDVVCADNDAARLSTLTDLAPAFFDQQKLPDQEPGVIRAICADLSTSNWPFGRDAFSSIVCVHYPNFDLLDVFSSSIVRGGYLYIETFGGQGANYLALPRAGHLRSVLEAKYDVIFYGERAVGPSRLGRVAAKLLARKT